MRLQMIRWRLPLSYAALAVLAALTLGAILLGMLRAYYDRRERTYLEANAAAVSAQLAPMLVTGAPSGAIQAQVDGYAFLLQSRVQVADVARGLTIDSGPPTMLGVKIEAWRVPVGESSSASAPGYLTQILVSRADVSAAAPLPTPPAPPQPPGPGSMAEAQAVEEQRQQLEAEQAQRAPKQAIARTLYGFNLGPEAAREAQRSSMVAVVPIIDPQNSQPIGEVRFLEGPAYGREIVRQVALSLTLAGLLATGLAAAIGWYVSGQVTRPLSTLANATERMAGGDLTTRVELRRHDEIGLLAQAFNRMAARVDTTVQILRRFVADAAHELNTPLTALQTNLDLAQEASDTDELRHYVARASADASRLERLAKDLLNLSRLEADSSDIGFVPLDLVQLVGELSESYGAWAEQAGLHFSVTMPTSALVHGSAGQVRQAIGNIIANAIKFTPPGGRVEVRVAEEAAWVVVAVEDSGIGIPSEEIPHLFERFHRGRNVSAYPGSGLGLAIVRATMVRHGGTASVESSTKGSCFTLRWPRRSGASLEAA